MSPDALVEIADVLAANPGPRARLHGRGPAAAGRDAAESEIQAGVEPRRWPTPACFPGNLSVIRRERLLTLGSFRAGFESVAWFDVLLRLGDTLKPEQVAHVPLVLHHAAARGRKNCRSRTRPTRTPARHSPTPRGAAAAPLRHSCPRPDIFARPATTSSAPNPASSQSCR
ncbi:MAG: hypothetical protein WDM96_02890 [Lacunisphaera sp.]